MNADRSPCPNCGRVSYDRKLTLQVGDVDFTVCNECCPTEVAVPVEFREKTVTVSTGTVRAHLDWAKDNPLTDTQTNWTLELEPLERPLLLGRVRNWLRSLWGTMRGASRRSE